MKDIIIRNMEKNEIDNIRKIDRSEIINHVYYFENDKLILKEEFYDIKGWNPNEIDSIINNLYSLYECNGYLYGAFKNSNLIGIIALESRFIGKNEDQLQLVFLHIDQKYRDKGLGHLLMDKAKLKAKELGAKKLYISATPSEHTIGFYLSLNCKLASDVNPELYQLEPEDIHLELEI